jgi:hypothetical protein
MFDVRHGDDRYSIGRLIIGRADQLALSRSEIVTRLGYRNLSKGHRLLTSVLTTARVPAYIVGNLVAALDVESDAVRRAMAETAAQRRAEAAAQSDAEDREYRANFRPHLRVETECERPSPIFLVAMLGLSSLRIVPISGRSMERGRDHARADRERSDHGSLSALRRTAAGVRQDCWIHARYRGCVLLRSKGSLRCAGQRDWSAMFGQTLWLGDLDGQGQADSCFSLLPAVLRGLRHRQRRSPAGRRDPVSDREDCVQRGARAMI